MYFITWAELIGFGYYMFLFHVETNAFSIAFVSIIRFSLGGKKHGYILK